MTGANLSADIARPFGFNDFALDPLSSLILGQAAHGNLFVLRDAAPIFSRTSDCAGVVAALGVDLQRAVLSNSETFRLPASAAEVLRLPKNIRVLNRSLHSMSGTEHDTQRRIIQSLLGTQAIPDLVWKGIEEFDESRNRDATVGLLSEMRELAVHVSRRLLFGERDFAGTAQLTTLLDTYFWLRREAASPLTSPNCDLLEHMLAIGTSLDELLRSYIRQCRNSPTTIRDGLVAQLATHHDHGAISEDAVVGHSNILFISATEPIAITLTWIFLILTQRPALADEMRTELHQAAFTKVPTSEELARLTLLESVIKEALRLLPPNAFMVRVTSCDTSLQGIQLPARCEVVLAPLMAHRDPEAFTAPNTFDPRRWNHCRPSPFAYFPFGAGGHACVGSALAMQIIKLALAFFLSRYDFFLAHDLELDWRLHIQLLPSCDPEIFVTPMNSARHIRGGLLAGPVADLLGF